MAAPQLLLTLVLWSAPDAAAEIERGRKLAVEGQWAEAARVLSPYIDADQAAAGPLALLTRAVLEAGDIRRARLLSERGLLRFPDDLRFRRLDLAVLIARRQWTEASAAARSVLAQTPDDPVAWRQLAAAALGEGDDVEKRVALEAAYFANPSDPLVLEKHVRAQFIAGHLATAEALLDAAEAMPRLAGDARFVGLAVRIAEAAGQTKRARRWLRRVPAADRGTSLSLLEARVALQDDDAQAAEAALVRLVDRGEANPSVLVRAAQLAERRGALGRAEALYAQAAEGAGDQGQVAQLFYARFLAKIGQIERSEERLLAYLADHPADAYARQLLRLVRAPSAVR